MQQKTSMTLGTGLTHKSSNHGFFIAWTLPHNLCNRKMEIINYGNGTKYEVPASIRSRYRSASKKEKRKILDEFCATCKYNRKYAVRSINTKTRLRVSRNLSKRGSKKPYNNPVISKVLRDIRVTKTLLALNDSYNSKLLHEYFLELTLKFT
jgi:hypothetical protein